MRYAPLLLPFALLSFFAQSEEANNGQPKAPVEPETGSRLLWEMKNAGGADRIVELAAAKDKLLCVQHGALLAFDARSGKLLWRYPQEGPVTEFADTTYETVRPFIIAVVGDEVITQIPTPIGQRGRGCVAFKLDDGTISRQFALGPEFGGGTDLSSHIGGSQVAFWKSPLNRDAKVTPVCVFDLKEWKELGRFAIQGETGELRAVDGRVCGLMIRNGEKFARAFAVDLKDQQLFSVPIRDRQTFQLRLGQLPDGSRIQREGRISEKCAYMYPCTMEWLDKSSPAIDGDRSGITGIDPQTQKKLWSCPGESGSAAVLMQSGNQLLAGGKGFLRIVDIKTGALRVSIRAADSFAAARLEDDTQSFAIDAKRAYWAWPFGLKVYRINPLDPAHADPHDEAEPAYAVAQCRAALQAGEYEAAIDALRGVAVALGLRPEARRSVIEMFSQLMRSPAAAELPKQWTELVCSDGWIAGPMFEEDYERWAGDEPAAAEALLRMNTQNSLKALAGLLDRAQENGKQFHPFSLNLAAAASERLTGKPAAVPARFVPPASEYERGVLSPEEYLTATQGRGEFAAAARAEIESKARGEGDKEPIKISTPGDADKTDVKGDF